MRKNNIGELSMKRKLYLLCICFCVLLCSCQKNVLENESKEDTAFLEQYNKIFVRENAKRAALIYLDEDAIPELLLIKNGAYQLYSFDGSEVKNINPSDPEIKMKVYGPGHEVEERTENQKFYWFEYVPYKGLIRVHDGTIRKMEGVRRHEQERHDYYLKYTDGFLTKELEVKTIGEKWCTYDTEQEIENEEFLSQISELGYDQLIPCGFLYETIEDAYKNIGASTDTKKVLEDFVSGKTNAVNYVEEIRDIPEDGFIMRSFEDFYNDMISGEEYWGRIEYADFDNDREEELIIRGYCNTRLFFDVIGDTVYRLFETTATTDVGNVCEIEGKKVIERTDILHVGRQIYRITQYDSCCCIIDWFELATGFEGDRYSAEDEFYYRGRKISMEEFEAVRDSIVFDDYNTEYGFYYRGREISMEEFEAIRDSIMFDDYSTE